MLDEKPGFHLRPQDSRLSLLLSPSLSLLYRVCASVGMCVFESA